MHETSIYRRWKTRDGLTTEATFALFAQNIPVHDRGSLLDDLVATLAAAAKYLDSPLARAAFQFGLDTTGTNELHELWSTRYLAFEQIFERAATRGEWPDDADPRPLLQALIGFVYLRVYVVREPFTPRDLRPSIEAILEGRPH